MNSSNDEFAGPLPELPAVLEVKLVFGKDGKPNLNHRLKVDGEGNYLNSEGKVVDYQSNAGLPMLVEPVSEALGREISGLACTYAKAVERKLFDFKAAKEKLCRDAFEHYEDFARKAADGDFPKDFHVNEVAALKDSDDAYALYSSKIAGCEDKYALQNLRYAFLK